jgi:hypothetical protein
MSLSKRMKESTMLAWITEGADWIRQVAALERENARMKSELDKHEASSLPKLSEKIDHVLDSQDKPMSASELEEWYTQALEMEEELEQTKKEHEEQVRYLNGQIRDLQADVHRAESKEEQRLRWMCEELIAGLQKLRDAFDNVDPDEVRRYQTPGLSNPGLRKMVEAYEDAILALDRYEKDEVPEIAGAESGEDRADDEEPPALELHEKLERWVEAARRDATGRAVLSKEVLGALARDAESLLKQQEAKVAELDRYIRWFVGTTTALRSVTKKVKGDPNQLDDLSPEIRQVVLSALSYVHTYETEYLPEHVEEQDQDGFIFPKDPLSELR